MIRKFLIKVFKEAIRVELTHFRYELFHKMLSDIGLDDLEKIIQKGKDNRKRVGHTDYTNLTEIYLMTMRGRLHEIAQDHASRNKTNSQT